MSGLNIEAIRAKLNELSSKTKINDVLWKPTEGDSLIRVVPLAENPENCFKEAYFHYLGGKTYLSPLTFNEADPIEEFAQQLRAGGNLSKDEWNETKKFIPKLRTFAPIVIRGKESDGVRFWGFGKTVYQELLSFIADEEYGDITHPKTGRDIKVSFIPGEKSDTKFPKTKIRVSLKQTPITDDPNLMEKILNVQPNLFDFYDKLSYNELKQVLDKYLAPNSDTDRTAASSDDWGEESEVSAIIEPATHPTQSPTKEKSTSTSAKSTKKNIEADFEAMFNA